MRLVRAVVTAASTFISMGSAMARERIRISSVWGGVTAELIESAATRALLRMLPVTLSMRDHLRQEKTGNLPSSLPEGARQRDFAAGTLGLWGRKDFVIYYTMGQVPDPGIVVLGKVMGDVSSFNRPGSVAVRVASAER